MTPGDPTARLPVADRLTTARLVLRPFVAEDAPALAAYRSDPDTARYQSWTTPYGLDEAAAFVAAVTEEQPGTPGTAFQYALEHRDTPGLVGDVMLATGGDRRLLELGVTLAPAVRGQGLATEAITALLDHVLVEVAGTHRVEARCDPRNVASVALWERLGFRREGHLVATVWTDDDGWTDDVVFAVLADEWRTGRAHERAGARRG